MERDIGERNKRGEKNLKKCFCFEVHAVLFKFGDCNAQVTEVQHSISRHCCNGRSISTVQKERKATTGAISPTGQLYPTAPHSHKCRVGGWSKFLLGDQKFSCLKSLLW